MPLVFSVEDDEPGGFDAGPCAPWDPIWCCDLGDASPTLQGQMAGIATEVLWARSGRQFGLCQLTGVRPCREECWQGASVGLGYGAGYGSDGSLAWARTDAGWVNVGCGGCSSGCSCSSTEQAVLPGPVNRVIEVRVDGQVIPTGSYRVDNERFLVRQDGGSWPLCQNDSLPAGAVGTWDVTYLLGLPPPELGRAGVGELGCQLLNACTGAPCALPFDVQELTRQGVTMRGAAASLAELLKSKRLGLPICDLFIGTYNPNGLDAPSQVWSPDLPTLRRPGG